MQKQPKLSFHTFKIFQVYRLSLIYFSKLYYLFSPNFIYFSLFLTKIRFCVHTSLKSILGRSKV